MKFGVVGASCRSISGLGAGVGMLTWLLPTVVKHAEGFGCAVGQINAALDVHLRQKWAAISYNHSDTLTTKANIQDSAKRQSSVSSDELLVVVHLAVGARYFPPSIGPEPPTQ